MSLSNKAEKWIASQGRQGVVIRGWVGRVPSGLTLP